MSSPPQAILTTNFNVTVDSGIEMSSIPEESIDPLQTRHQSISIVLIRLFPVGKEVRESLFELLHQVVDERRLGHVTFARDGVIIVAEGLQYFRAVLQHLKKQWELV